MSIIVKEGELCELEVLFKINLRLNLLSHVQATLLTLLDTTAMQQVSDRCPVILPYPVTFSCYVNADKITQNMQEGNKIE